MSGEHTLHEPGDRVPVRVESDADGNIPDNGDLVAVVGESRNGVHVALPAATGEGVALLTRVAFGDDGESLDPDASYDANTEVGGSMVKLRHAVDWFFTSDTATFTPGDPTVSDAGGTVRAYDEAGGDTADLQLGPVWRTRPFAEGTGEKVAVVRHR